MSDAPYPFKCRVEADQAGERLDRWLSVPLPETGLRLRRRLIEDGRVLVNGSPAPKGLKVRAGQVVELVRSPQGTQPPRPGIVARTRSYAAVAKPAGLHSARVAGRNTPSVEDCLPSLFPDGDARLLNRLDGPTSGLLLVGFGQGAEDRFRRLEAAGEVEKTYLAVVHGRMSLSMVLRNALDTANRRRSRVLAAEDPDPARWTSVTPLDHYTNRDLSLVTAIIRRGARHQIRAHLAAAGYPILGDDLYGPEAESDPDDQMGRRADVAQSRETASGAPERLYLHHSRVAFDGFVAELEPDWPCLMNEGA